MNDDELGALLADLAKQHAEDRAKTDQAMRETSDPFRRQAVQHTKTDEVVRPVSKQLGGLGNKFGSFTEGLAFESLERVLRAKFHADDFARHVKVIRGERAQEYDVIGVRNEGHGEVFCVEIKSELNAEQLQKSLKKFSEFFNLLPRYRGMKLYGIICAVDVRGALADLVMSEGLYLATAGDENFKLVKPPRGFQPRVFTAG